MAFTPSTPVVLGATGTPTASCVIDFTASVLKAPTKDANPGTPGLQTDHVGFAAASSNGADPGFAQGSSTGEVTVNRGTVPIATQVSPA